MSSRTALVVGALGLVAITGAILWFTQVHSTGSTTVPTTADGKSEHAVGAGSDHELAVPEKLATPTRTDRGSSSRDGKPAASGRQPAADPKAAKQGPGATTLAAGPGALEVVALEPATAATEPPKLSSLGAISGGAGAIKGKYFGSTYAERRERADLLESALGGGDPQDKDLLETFKALKDELVWLRENMGTPPSEPPK
jgi:hypothetical protein